jgi:hypothetical protein
MPARGSCFRFPPLIRQAGVASLSVRVIVQVRLDGTFSVLVLTFLSGATAHWANGGGFLQLHTVMEL